MASAPTVARGRVNKRVELADVFRQFGQRYLRKINLPARHRKVMQQIMNCRTAVLGGHRQWCASCDYQRYVYHSCRNRHCPKCQASAKERWREARQAELLPVPYFHNVFTLPHELNGLTLHSEFNQRQLLDLLFQATAATLQAFGRKTFGGQIGFTAVLHTWDQRLNPHFHLHCLIPSGALKKTTDGYAWAAGGNRFLFAVRGLSAMFRAKFLTGLRALLKQQALDLPPSMPAASVERLIKRLFKKPWVIYSKAPFAGPKKLLDYLSRYTHRVALTNDRLKSITGDQVIISYRDRRDGDRRKTMPLPAVELIDRFMKHVLPSGLARIRHYGFLANRFKQQRLKTIRVLLGQAAQPLQEKPTDWLTQWLEEILGAAQDTCPCCGEELMQDQLPSQLVHRSQLIANQRTRPPP